MDISRAIILIRIFSAAQLILALFTLSPGTVPGPEIELAITMSTSSGIDDGK